jgi:hypothetical protein
MQQSCHVAQSLTPCCSCYQTARCGLIATLLGTMLLIHEHRPSVTAFLHQLQSEDSFHFLLKLCDSCNLFLPGYEAGLGW